MDTDDAGISDAIRFTVIIMTPVDELAPDDIAYLRTIDKLELMQMLWEDYLFDEQEKHLRVGETDEEMETAADALIKAQSQPPTAPELAKLILKYRPLLHRVFGPSSLH